LHIFSLNFNSPLFVKAKRKSRLPVLKLGGDPDPSGLKQNGNPALAGGLREFHKIVTQYYQDRKLL